MCSGLVQNLLVFFCQQFLSLGLKTVEDNSESEHDLAGMVE